MVLPIILLAFTFILFITILYYINVLTTRYTLQDNIYKDFLFNILEVLEIFLYSVVILIVPMLALFISAIILHVF